MALAEKRIQMQCECCCVCDEPLDVQEWKAQIVGVDEEEIEYFHTDIECEDCAFGIED